MTKRNLKNLYSWSKEFVFILLLILPLVAYAIFCIHQQEDLLTFMNTFFIDLSSFSVYSIFTDLLNNIFSTSITSNIISWFCTYYLMIELIHLGFDVLLFIPRVGEKFIRRVIDD